MSDTGLYETDILAWSEQQVAALRALASRRDLPNALDLPHVLAEIEDVGQSECNAVRSFIRLILGHAIKCVADPDAPSVRHRHAEIGNWQSELVDRLTPAMSRKIDLARLWRRAMRQAELDLLEQGREAAVADLAATLSGEPCPVVIEDLLDDPSDPAALVARIATMPPPAA